MCSPLCVSNLVAPPTTTSSPTTHLQHVVQSPNYFHSHGVSRNHPTTNPHSIHSHPGLLSPHSTSAPNHCFPSPEAANAARLAYFNSPAAAAFITASMQNMHSGFHPNSSAANPCISSPSVNASISMFHSFNSDSTVSPRPENGPSCGPAGNLSFHLNFSLN